MSASIPLSNTLISKVMHRPNVLWLHVQIVSLDDDMTMPEGWGMHTPPPASPWTDASIYELHIRDFR